VFDLSENNPERVLRTLWRNLEEQAAAGNPSAARVRQRLRILVCGGDGTVAWLFKVVRELNLKPTPPIAIMPLGTGAGRGAAACTPGGGAGCGGAGCGGSCWRPGRGPLVEAGIVRPQVARAPRPAVAPLPRARL
jgi:hypothetical protein